MEARNVRLEITGAVGVLTLDRPKALNALDADTVGELLDCLREVHAGREVRCLVLTGAGDKAFCAGADIAAMRAMSAIEGKAWARLGQGLTAAIEELPLPVIAAVNGFALGGGLELAMACDFIV